MKNTGLIKKYHIMKIRIKEDGVPYLIPVDSEAEYFVLRLDEGGEPEHVNACRQAILVYASIIKGSLPKLSEDLFKKYGV